MINYIKSIIAWLFSKQGLKAIRIAIEIASMSKKFAGTKGSMNDALYLARKMNEATEGLTEAKKKKFVQMIDDNASSLKDVRAGYSYKNGFKIEFGGIKTGYNPKDGSFDIGLNSKIK